MSGMNTSLKLQWREPGVIILDQAVDFDMEDICILFTDVFWCVTYGIPTFFNSLEIREIFFSCENLWGGSWNTPNPSASKWEKFLKWKQVC